MRKKEGKYLSSEYEHLSLLMYKWLMSSAGAELYDVEYQAVDYVFKSICGHWMCTAGLFEQQYSLLSDIMPNNFSLGCLRTDGMQACSDIHFWPVQSMSMDAVLLHHALEWTKQPQRVLREASRVLCPGGTLVVVGFNPISLGALSRFFSSRYPRVLRQANLYSASVIIEWLNTLGFSCESIHFALRLAPFCYTRSAAVLATMKDHSLKGTLNKLPLGNIFILVAVKERAGLIFGRDAWKCERKSVIGASYARSGWQSIDVNCVVHDANKVTHH